MVYSSVSETEFDVLCHSCQEEVGVERPQFYGMVAFKGDYESIVCGRCEEVIVFR